jgi:hypothetical protein
MTEHIPCAILIVVCSCAAFLLAAAHCVGGRAETKDPLSEAAPELLDALTALMQWVENWEPNFTQDDEWPADRERFRAAIAKAQGTDQ